MKSDILFPNVEGISIAVLKEDSNQENLAWKVYLINSNNFDITNITIRSKGYGTNAIGEQEETSILRYFINSIAANKAEQIEPIYKEVLHLYNEYWVSYFVNNQIYDKKFIFVPDSIIEQNLTWIPLLNASGVLHS